jgi:hypothetical protein
MLLIALPLDPCNLSDVCVKYLQQYWCNLTLLCCGEALEYTALCIPPTLQMTKKLSIIFNLPPFYRHYLRKIFDSFDSPLNVKIFFISYNNGTCDQKMYYLLYMCKLFKIMSPKMLIPSDFFFNIFTLSFG